MPSEGDESCCFLRDAADEVSRAVSCLSQLACVKDGLEDNAALAQDQKHSNPEVDEYEDVKDGVKWGGLNIELAEALRSIVTHLERGGSTNLEAEKALILATAKRVVDV